MMVVVTEDIMCASKTRQKLRAQGMGFGPYSTIAIKD